MSSADLRSIARWPNVPACYGWVVLDARGRWRLGPDGGELVRHPGLVAFLNQNYHATADGAWFIQNGPQRAFVTLERAPFIVRLDPSGTLATQTGCAVRDVSEALVDADGNAYVSCELGLAGIDDRDLSVLVIDGPGDALHQSNACIRLGTRQFALIETDLDELSRRFGFVRHPQEPC